MDQQCLSIQEVAKYLNLTTSTIYRLVKRGAVPGFKVGGQWRFTRDNLEAWIIDQVMIERLKAEHRQSRPRQPRNG